MLDINVEKYEVELNDILFIANEFFKTHQISNELWGEIKEETKENLLDFVKRNYDSHVDAYWNLEGMTQSLFTHKYNPRVTGKFFTNRPAHTRLGETHAVYLSSLATRVVIIERIIDFYSKLDAWDVACSDSVVKANSTWDRQVKTNVGYRNQLTIKLGTPGKFEAKVEEVKNGHIQYKACLATAYVDGTYSNLIRPLGIDIVDIAGKTCLTTAAEEIHEHELVSDNVRLFKATVIYSKVSRDSTTYYVQDDDMFFFCEDRYIAVQEVTGGRNIVATGKDASWAIRTMRGRIKKQILSMMDV